MILQPYEICELINDLKVAVGDETKPERRRVRLADCGERTELSLSLAYALGYNIKKGEA
jgi:hypothetical protein